LIFIRQNFFNEQKYVEAYYAKDIQKELALGRSQFVALAMLLGGDYTDGVKGVGIVNGMEILQSFAIDDGKEGVRDGLQRFREWLDGLDDPLAKKGEGESATFLSKVQLFHKKHQSARTRWIAPSDFPSNAIIDGYMKPAVDSSTVNFTWGKPDIEGLRQFCANSIGWENEETDGVVQPVLKILESGSTQTRIESYFMKYDDNIKFAAVKSKRLKAVLDDIQTGDGVEGSHKRQRTD
jgi:DNA excision repair protein ERCC-5